MSRTLRPIRRWAVPLALAQLAGCAPAPIVPYSLDTPPLVLTPAGEAGIADQRGRFREILCAVDAAVGRGLPDWRPCDAILHRLDGEPPGSGAPVPLGPPRAGLEVAIVPGFAADCLAGLVTPLGDAAAHLRKIGYPTHAIAIEGLSGSARNGELIRDQVMALPLPPGRRLVLIGYSKGLPDILEGLVAYPELAGRIAAVVGLAAAVNGSLLSEDAPRSLAPLLEHLPGSECGPGDGGAIDSLTRAARLRFIAAHRLPAGVRYYSLVAFAARGQVSAALRHTYDRLAQVDPRNDAELLLYDQVIPGSRLLGYVDADHWAVALPVARDHPALGATLLDRNAFPREVLLEAIMRHVEEQLGEEQLGEERRGAGPAADAG